MRFVRLNRRIGTALIVAAVIVAILSPNARPSIRELLVAVGIAIVVGVVIGLMVRHVVPLERRLRVLHALGPRTASRLLRRRGGH